MKAKLITYDLSNLSQYKKVLVNRALYGYNDHSNKGLYTYRRKGILSKIPHLKLVRGAVIVEAKNQKAIVSILKKDAAKYFMFNIEINKSMLH